MIHVGKYSNNKRFQPTVLNTPTVLMISPHIYHDIPHGTEHPIKSGDIQRDFKGYS